MPEEFVRFVSDASRILESNGDFYLNMKIGDGVEMRRVPKANYPGGAEVHAKLQGDRFYAYYTEHALDSVLSKAFEVRTKRALAPHTEEMLEYWLVLR